MSKVKILVIEDDPYICELIRLYGEKNGYHLDLAYDGEAGLDKFYQQNPDLVILDVMMPKMDGWEVCKFIRIDYKTPIIMLTARGDIYDRLKGFELGVDDYVTKPFEPEELMARIKAVLKRTNPLLEESKLVEYPFLTINLAEYKVYLHGEEIEMPLKEISLLYYLATRPNQVFTRQQLLDEIWGFAYEGDPRTVDVHVKRIREKLQDEPTWNLKTIRGVGYKFEVQKEV
ncbi:MAG: winged helix family two component transcriptional regulator [Bacillus sp. (in: firmicutes)]|jgi:DNA-binding response OmpR family regulator|nr:winged helix family two component transcriptional regulator [Bacillus sp. (in: firmicutes)]